MINRMQSFRSLAFFEEIGADLDAKILINRNFNRRIALFEFLLITRNFQFCSWTAIKMIRPTQDPKQDLKPDLIPTTLGSESLTKKDKQTRSKSKFQI